MVTALFPRKGDRLRAHSVFFQAVRIAASGVGILSGCTPSRSSATAITIASGTYTDGSGAAPISYAGGSITSIPAASAGKHRYDLIVLNVSTGAVSRIAGSENVPTISTDFLENVQPLPPELASTVQAVVAIIIVTSSGIPSGNFGHYATAGVANMIIEVPSPSIAKASFSATSRIAARKTTGAGAAEECTLSEILDFIGSAAGGDILYRTSSGWARLAKSTQGYLLIQGALYPYWGLPKLDDLAAPDDSTDLDASTSKHGLMSKFPGGAARLSGDGSWDTPYFGVAFMFGDGVSVMEADAQALEIPIASKIVEARIRSYDSSGALLSGSVTCTLYRHAYNAVIGSAVDSFALSSANSFSETGLAITVTAKQWLTVVLSGISKCKRIELMLKFEAT